MTARTSTPVPTGPVVGLGGNVQTLIETAALLTDTPEDAACALIAAAAMILRSTGIDADAAELPVEALRDPDAEAAKGGGL
jgi:hypothetical protein